jgi:protein TonB
MKRTAEVTVFSGLAVLIHVGLFASVPEPGVRSSGAGGEAMVSLEAADATIAQMIVAWEHPPSHPQVEGPDLIQPQTPTVAPQMAQFGLADAPAAALLVALAEPEEVNDVEIDQSTPPPPPLPDPEPEPEPKPASKPRPKPRENPPAARISTQTSPCRAAQRAAGSGNGAVAGTSGGATAATVSAGQRAKLQAIWGAKIRSRIERRKRYPSGASGSGRVVLRVTVAASGALVNYRVATTSGVDAFDQAALKAVARAGQFPKAPRGYDAAQLTFNLPMAFSK